jgi:hypothetical protein
LAKEGFMELDLYPKAAGLRSRIVVPVNVGSCEAAREGSTVEHSMPQHRMMLREAEGIIDPEIAAEDWNRYVTIRYPIYPLMISRM